MKTKDKIKKTITISEPIYQLVMKAVKEDFASTFNREINFILMKHFEEEGELVAEVGENNEL